jgi:hypothetical protein
LSGRSSVIERFDVPVMLATCPDALTDIQALWPDFETRVDIRGRRMYALVDVHAGTYSPCTPIRPADDPAALGLAIGVLPGGRFLRGRLCGAAPELYAKIAPGMDELLLREHVDPGRPLVEFYRRQDEIELWVPVLDE